jgi:hypothetical protein
MLASQNGAACPSFPLSGDGFAPALASTPVQPSPDHLHDDIEAVAVQLDDVHHHAVIAVEHLDVIELVHEVG